jgi:hypothetical protein
METLEKTLSLDFFNLVFNIDRWKYTASQYVIQGDRMVRFSNHLPKSHNLVQNEDVKYVLFVFVNAGLSQREIDTFSAEIESEMEYEHVETTLHNDDEDGITLEDSVFYTKLLIEQFLGTKI